MKKKQTPICQTVELDNCFSCKVVAGKIHKKKCDIERFKKFFHGMLNEGVYFAPSAYEAGFVSSAHGEKEIEKTVAAAEKVFAAL